MIEGFNVKDQALGTGDNSVYTFDFKIYDPSDILIWVQDAAGNIVEKIRGDDTTFLSSLTFDTINGGGTLTLAANLPDDYSMTMLLAPDAPDQPTGFPNKKSFSFDVLEGAIDFLASSIQRIAYLAQRASVLHDLDDIDSFDPTLPLKIGSNPGGIVSVKEDGSGFEIVITIGEIVAAQGYAADALASQNAAEASQIAAAASAVLAQEAAESAESGIFPYGKPSSPLNIDASGITFNDHQEEAQFVQGNGGNVLITQNPQISPGSAIGQRLYLSGCNDGRTLKLTNGNGLSLNGDCTLGQDDLLALMWADTYWTEIYRRSAT